MPYAEGHGSGWRVGASPRSGGTPRSLAQLSLYLTAQPYGRLVATETFFERTPEGHVYATQTRHLSTGATCGSQDDDIHQMSNIQPAEDLVTLHVYSPPLLTMGVYSLTEQTVRSFCDPIVGLVHGDGI